MLESIKLDIISVFKSKYIYLCILIIIISCIGHFFITTRENDILSDNKIDIAGMFIAGVAFKNTLLDILAPMLPAIACIPLWKPYLNNNILELNDCLCNKKFIKSRVISTFFVGGSVYFVSLLLYIIISAIFNPNTQGEEIVLFYDFSYIYNTNQFMYLAIYIAQATLFGSIYSFFSMSILLITKNISMYIIIPSAVYFCAVYFGILFPPLIKDIIFWMTPIYTFGLESLSYSEIKSIVELLSVFLISILITCYSYKRDCYKYNQEPRAVI